MAGNRGNHHAAVPPLITGAINVTCDGVNSVPGDDAGNNTDCDVTKL